MPRAYVLIPFRAIPTFLAFVLLRLECPVAIKDVGAEAKCELVVFLGPLSIVLVAVEHTANDFQVHGFVDDITEFHLGIKEICAQSLSGSVIVPLKIGVIGFEDILTVVQIVHVQAVHGRDKRHVANPTVALITDLNDSLFKIGAQRIGQGLVVISPVA